MSYTFGGATGHDMTFTTATNAGGSLQALLVAGWWYPTTLTSGRFYWSFGNVFGASINSTTDQLLMFTDNTTDGQWTADPNIVVNKWWFLAWLFTANNTGPAGAWRVWAGDAVTPPAEFTVTNTVAPVGNFSGSTSRTVGNRGTGTVGFQGQVGWMTTITNSTSGLNTFLPIGTGGAISDDEASIVYNRWVLPLWLGRPSVVNNLAASNISFSMTHVPCLTNIKYDYGHAPATPSIQVPTLNGATFSSNFPPTMPPGNWLHQRKSTARV